MYQHLNQAVPLKPRQVETVLRNLIPRTTPVNDSHYNDLAVDAPPHLVFFKFKLKLYGLDNANSVSVRTSRIDLRSFMHFVSQRLRYHAEH